jgi:hypothetical protein
VRQVGAALWLSLMAAVAGAGAVAGAAGASGARDDAALRAVDACRASLDARTDIGIERIQKRCPDLLPALDAAPWRELLPHTLRERREELSAESLRALAELVRNANTSGVQGTAPDTTQLAPVLAALGAHGQEGATRWERFKRWIKQLRNPKGADDEGGILTRWSRELATSEGVARVISYIGYSLLGLLVLFVIGAELRAAGVFDARRRAAARNSPEAQWHRRLMLADVGAAPLAERPGMLLRLLGEALARAQRLPAADGLTAGAIAARARLETDADRAELAQVARTADEIRYADRVPPASTLEATVTAAKSLLVRITASKERR